MEQPHVVILGGGLTGLVTAYRLRQLHGTSIPDLKCTIVERDTRFGGKIHTKRSDAYTLELGPDSIFTRKPWGVELIHELGLTSDIVPVNSGGGTFIWHDDRLQPLPAGFNAGVPSDLSAFAKTELLSLDGKRRALEDLFLTDGLEKTDTSLGKFLRNRLGDEVVDTIATPLLAGIHAGDIDRMSLDATMPVLRRVFQEHASLILGVMAQKNNTTAHGTTAAGPVFINLRNGLEQLIDTLVEKVRGFVDFQTNTVAVKVTKVDSGRYEVTTMKAGHPHRIAADAVVVATPAAVAADLLSGVGFAGHGLRSIRYASTATISFGYKHRPGMRNFVGSGYLVPRTKDAFITACTIVSTKWSHASKTGDTIIRCYVGHDGREDAVDWDDNQMTREMLSHLKQTLGISESPDFVEIKRWYDSMPQYDIGHIERVNEAEAELQRFPGIALAGAAYHGVGIPDCIRDATRAANQIFQYLLNRG